LKDKKLNSSKLKFVSLQNKKNRIKIGIKPKKRLTYFFLNETIYCLFPVGSDVITFTKYNWLKSEKNFI